MWTILTVVCLAALVCGPIWAIARYLRVELPKFLLPMLAGLTIFSYNIYMSYSWIDRTVSSYGPNVVVLKEYRSKSFFAPWTLVVPRVSHFIAANIKMEPQLIEGTNIIEGALVAMQEHIDPKNMAVLIKCLENQVSIMPIEKVAQVKSELDLALWTNGSEFPYVIDFYCQK